LDSESCRIVSIGEAEPARLRADSVALGQILFAHREIPAICRHSFIVYVTEAVALLVIFQEAASNAHSTTCSTTPALAEAPIEVILYPLSSEAVLEQSSRAAKEQSEIAEESNLYKDIRFVFVVRL